ncbi:MAG: antibiotic biosynthesis monooxygenase [Actinomycetota bacterium]
MNGDFYTHAMWRVRPGSEEEFERIWREELAPAFRAVGPDATGTLIQSLQDSQLFFSFGPWASLEEMERARSDPEARRAIAKLLALCDEASPGAYKLVLRIPEPE